MIHDENFNGEKLHVPLVLVTQCGKGFETTYEKCNDRPKKNTNSCYELDFNKLLNNAENFELANEEEEENTELIEKYIHILQK